MSAIVHCTAPLLAAMKLRPPAVEPGRRGDNALGPWSVTLLHARPQKLALAVCHASRHGFVMPAAPLAALPQRFGPALLELLLMLGAEAGVARREAEAMQPIVLAPTVERGVRSHMGQYKDLVLWLLAGGATLTAINERLAANLVMRPSTFHVGERTFELLGLGAAPLHDLEHRLFGPRWAPEGRG